MNFDLKSEIRMRYFTNLLRKPFLWATVLFLLFTSWITYLNVRAYQGSLTIDVGSETDTNTSARFKTFDTFATIFKTKPYTFLQNNYPGQRLSEPQLTDGGSTRQILLSPIYVHAKRLPRKPDPDTPVALKILFKSNAPLYVSPTDNRYKIFNWEPLFLPSLAGKFPIARVDDYSIFLTSQGRPYPLTQGGLQNLSNINSWIYTHLEKGSIVKTSGAKIPQSDFTTRAADLAWGEGITIISTPLRSESYSLYTYLDKPLNLSISKHDLNWTAGEDVLKIKIFDPKNRLVLEKIIADDGNNSNNKRVGGEQDLSITDQLLPMSGIFKITLEDGSTRKANDFEITRIEINSGKLVFDRLLVPHAETDVFTGPGKNPLSLEIFHNTATQNVNIGTEFGTYPVALIEVNKPRRIDLSKINQMAEISIPKGDLRLERQGFFAFSPEAYFEPLDYFIVDETATESDVLIISSFKSETEGAFYKAEKTFRWADLYPTKSGEIVFAIKTDDPQAEVFVDMIELEVRK